MRTQTGKPGQAPCVVSIAVTKLCQCLWQSKTGTVTVRANYGKIRKYRCGEVREWLNRAVSKTGSTHFSNRTKTSKSSFRSSAWTDYQFTLFPGFSSGFNVLWCQFGDSQPKRHSITQSVTNSGRSAIEAVLTLRSSLRNDAEMAGHPESR
jgi:hypothetical protein